MDIMMVAWCNLFTNYHALVYQLKATKDEHSLIHYVHWAYNCSMQYICKSS